MKRIEQFWKCAIQMLYIIIHYYTNEDIDMRSFVTPRGDRVILFDMQHPTYLSDHHVSHIKQNDLMSANQQKKTACQ